jgi:hypothetical protein
MLNRFATRFEMLDTSEIAEFWCSRVERFGETEKAYGLFNQSYRPNQVPPFGVISETAGGTNPYFATGAGGTLQTLLADFGSLDITDNGVEQRFKASLPKAWDRLVLKGIGGSEVDFVVE